MVLTAKKQKPYRPYHSVNGWSTGHSQSTVSHYYQDNLALCGGSQVNGSWAGGQTGDQADGADVCKRCLFLRARQLKVK